MNSVSCGGNEGVADSFATALWAPDALFELMRAGVDGVNWHIRAELVNAPFMLLPGAIEPLPELYGLALFLQMLGPEARRTGASVSASAGLHVKVWAVTSRNGTSVLRHGSRRRHQGARRADHSPKAVGASLRAARSVPTMSAMNYCATTKPRWRTSSRSTAALANGALANGRGFPLALADLVGVDPRPPPRQARAKRDAIRSSRRREAVGKFTGSGPHYLISARSCF
jgi:hypothetical protein